jgi:molybdopterin converting factor small subunit
MNETDASQPSKADLTVKVHFYSYFKELTGCSETAESLPPASTIRDLLAKLHTRFPKLAPMKNSTLIAVGLEYQDQDYFLQDQDEISLFPPVQGG